MTSTNVRDGSSFADRARLRSAPAAWRGITREEILTTFLLGCGLWLYHSLAVVLTSTLDLAFRPLLIHFSADQIKTFGLLLALLVADRAAATDPERRGLYALAVVLGAAAGMIAAVTALSILFHLLLDWGPIPTIAQILYSFLETVMLGAAIFWVINDRRRALRARARMHRAEIERIGAQKRSIESDLQAMQARVEPQFLFSTLAQVKRLYQRDAALGERMLDELIVYLRAAVPRMRDTSSTIGQEIDLARAYLAIVRLRPGERFDYTIDVPSGANDLRIPPMMLLPLVDHATARSLIGPQTNGSVHVHLELANEGVCLRIADSGAAFLPDNKDEAIAGIEERLHALYGDDARLMLHRQADGGTEAILQFRRESNASLAGASVAGPSAWWSWASLKTES